MYLPVLLDGNEKRGKHQQKEKKPRVIKDYFAQFYVNKFEN